jgi:hypothetical protein
LDKITGAPHRYQTILVRFNIIILGKFFQKPANALSEPIKRALALCCAWLLISAGRFK